MGTFGCLMRYYRKKAGVPLRTIADALGFSVTYVADIERGRRNVPDLEKVKMIVELIPGAEFSDMLRAAARDKGMVVLELTGNAQINELALSIMERWPSITEEEVLRVIDALE